jgi:hypothetical protein
MGRFIILSVCCLLAGIFIFQSCSKTHLFRSNYDDVNSLIHETGNLETKPFLKAHLKNGDVYILQDTWQVDTTTNMVSGFGSKYNYNRQLEFTGVQSIKIDSVSIFETNIKLNKPESGRVAALGIVAGLDVIMGIICLTNPKACFGSCPTFYIDETDNFHYADAEGFSNAISPSMEYADVDAIGSVIIANTFSITMKNEALETHAVNHVKLFAYPLKEGNRVYHTPDNNYYLCENTYKVKEAVAQEGDISLIINSADRLERYSLADEQNMLSKEEIFLNFNIPAFKNNLGLIINYRQTLMSTYLFYSAMGYMGDEVSDLYARLEQEPELREKFDACSKELGGIEVYAWDEQQQVWAYQDKLVETGPIAINKHIIPIKLLNAGNDVKLKLVLNRGLWRIDYVALTNIIEQVSPVEVLPAEVFNKGILDNDAKKLLQHADKHLISMPGSEYKLSFKFREENVNYELFLYSKGYYLEWMRENWIKEKDLLKLRQMAFNPKKYLKDEANSYKKYESTMEQQFWDSRIDTKTFAYYEN